MSKTSSIERKTTHWISLWRTNHRTNELTPSRMLDSLFNQIFSWLYNNTFFFSNSNTIFYVSNTTRRKNWRWSKGKHFQKYACRETSVKSVKLSYTTTFSSYQKQLTNKIPPITFTRIINKLTISSEWTSKIIKQQTRLFISSRPPVLQQFEVFHNESSPATRPNQIAVLFSTPVCTRARAFISHRSHSTTLVLYERACMKTHTVDRRWNSQGNSHFFSNDTEHPPGTSP